MKEKGCCKCGGTEVDSKDVAMTGTGLSRLMDLQHNTFKCGYSEFYNKQTSGGMNLADLFLG